MIRVQSWLRLALALGLVVSSLCAFAPADEAGPLTYRGGGQGTVIFDHRLHAAKGSTCFDCHTIYKETGKQLFQTQRQGLIDMADHGSSGKCFVCHNDTVTFSNCDQCHRK